MFSISREIGIDAGHRVPTHGSKCKNLHGHRYKIIATCRAAELHEEGEQQDMVLDFGFLKDEMMKEIDAPCDHGFIFWVEDDFCTSTFFPTHDNYGYDRVLESIYDKGYWVGYAKGMMKVYMVPFVPTAEKLAEHWFQRLAPRVKIRSEGKAELAYIDVHETPNCSARYPADPKQWTPQILHDVITSEQAKRTK